MLDCTCTWCWFSLKSINQQNSLKFKNKYFAPDGIVFWSLGLMSKGGCEYKDDPKHTMVLYHIHMSSPSNFWNSFSWTISDSQSRENFDFFTQVLRCLKKNYNSFFADFFWMRLISRFTCINNTLYLWENTRNCCLIKMTWWSQSLSLKIMNWYLIILERITF